MMTTRRRGRGERRPGFERCEGRLLLSGFQAVPAGVIAHDTAEVSPGVEAPQSLSLNFTKITYNTLSLNFTPIKD